MTFIHILNYCTICLIFSLALMFTYYSSKAKYSVLKAFLWAIFRWDGWYFRWFFKSIQNMLYFFCSTCVAFLVAQDLVLLTLFSQNNIFQKPIYVFLISPVLWANLIIVLFLALFKYTLHRKEEF